MSLMWREGPAKACRQIFVQALVVPAIPAQNFVNHLIFDNVMGKTFLVSHLELHSASFSVFLIIKLLASDHKITLGNSMKGLAWGGTSKLLPVEYFAIKV